MANRVTQSALIAVEAFSGAPSRVTQSALISVQAPPISPVRVTQTALIMVVEQGYIKLPMPVPISLPCSSSCLQFFDKRKRI